MSLFPITDIIMQICAELTAAEVLGLMQVNCAVRAQLLPLTRPVIRVSTIKKKYCRFTVTETQIMDIPAKTEIVLKDWDRICSFNFAGSIYPDMIVMCVLVYPQQWFIHTKNNTAFAAVRIANMDLRNIPSRYWEYCVFIAEHCHVLDFIALVVNYTEHHTGLVCDAALTKKVIDCVGDYNGCNCDPNFPPHNELMKLLTK